MPRHPFQAWSPNSNPEGIEAQFSPLFATGEVPERWRPIDYAPVVGSTKALVEAQLAGGQCCALKALVPEGPAMTRWQASREVSHPLFWAREAHFFRSSASQAATPSFRAVHCLGQIDLGEEICMKLEWVRGRPGPVWLEADYEQAAYALGTWQRALRRLPAEPWVCRDWLGGYLALRKDADAHLAAPDLWQMANIFSKKEQYLVIDILEAREGLSKRLRSLPQLPAHNDFWPPNLFLVDAQVVAIDWAFVGPAALGSDLCTLAFDSIYDGFFAPSDAYAFVLKLKRAYAEGAGLGDDADLEFAIQAGLLVKYLWFFAHVQLHGNSQDASWQGCIEALRLVLTAGEKLKKAGAV